MTGGAWGEHLSDKAAAEGKKPVPTEWGRLRRNVKRDKTSFELRREQNRLGHHLATRRLNAERIVEAGCIISLGTDNYVGASPEFARDPKAIWQEPGIGTLIAIEGLVELGMTPADAIVSGTRNGAIAARDLENFGTIEVGKFADLVLLDADPLEDIHNIRQQSLIMKEGSVIDVNSLPTKPVIFAP